MAHTLVFDIGKTNKKAFIFDTNYQEVKNLYTRFDEQKDEDGFPCDNLEAIQTWMKKVIQDCFKNPEYEIKAINFSAYGASFVHLDNQGKALTPLYNYQKPLPQNIQSLFYQKYGDKLQIAQETASPPLGMLNSGLQLFWLKQTQPALFKKIRWSLHFPQYLSYLLTGIPVNEYTSIGCHTALWDFSKKDYHAWVYQEGITEKLPAIATTTTSINTFIEGQKVRIGLGIHDSSAALLPYLYADNQAFIVVSTGTWSITLNPFNQALLSAEDLTNDCLNLLSITGQPVKTARLFLGKEYQFQVQKLTQIYNVEIGAHELIEFNRSIFERLKTDYKRYFTFEYIQLARPATDSDNLNAFQDFAEAYHQLMLELMELQVQVIQRAIGKTKIQTIYIDGGFADNKAYVALMEYYFKDIQVKTSQSPLGSAKGAAMIVADS